MLRHSLLFGRITAIPIRFHWSWLVMLVAIVGVLSHFYAPYTSAAMGWLIATVAAVLLCASVVLHELGHALVARYYRLTVRSITLFALGGVAEIDGTSSDPTQEFLIAIAGPVVSLVLALVSGVLWFASPWTVGAMLALHLALTNGMMAIFNLLPGYPMDGGRVLRAVLWFLTDEELPSAHVAARIGRACGAIFVLLGVIYMFGSGDVINGAWLGFVGYFLNRSAMAGYHQLVLQRTLNDVSVADVMQRIYRAVTPDLPLDQFVRRFLLGNTDQGFPVLRQIDIETPQELLGMMTLRDLRRFTLKEWSLTRVGEAMTPVHHVATLTPGMSASDALRSLHESGQEQLPVVLDHAFLGILRRRDVMLYIQMRLARR